MNGRRRRNNFNSPPGTGGVARRAGVVVKSKFFDPSTTPSLRATPPVPGGELGNDLEPYAAPVPRPHLL